MAFKCTRWTLANILPVVFAVWIIVTIWFLYLWFHLQHLLRSKEAVEHQRGVWQAVVSQSLAVMLLICLHGAVFTDPGSVPNTPEWRTDEAKLKEMKGDVANTGDEPVRQGAPTNHHELKQTGERRFCKWCDQYKPDRCHHCRVCRSCVLRMDHHCPWIANCVGFRNHKYFFLLVFYALLNCLFVVVTMSESVVRAATDEMPGMRRFLIVFGMTLAVIMAVLLQLFFLIHVMLMFKAQTTIEHCENQSRRSGKTVDYDAGLLNNCKAVLGPNPLLWLLPTSPPEGEGLTFAAVSSKDQDSSVDDHLAEHAVASEGEAVEPIARDADTTAKKPDGPCAESNAKLSDTDSLPPEVTGAKAAAA